MVNWDKELSKSLKWLGWVKILSKNTSDPPPTNNSFEIYPKNIAPKDNKVKVNRTGKSKGSLIKWDNLLLKWGLP